MGVDASLYRVHQDGTGPRRRRLERIAVVMDAGDVVSRLPETHPGRFFSRIKPYGSLVLHSDELADFADDLEGVSASVHPQEKEPLAALIELSRQYTRQPGIELHLDGD